MTDATASLAPVDVKPVVNEIEIVKQWSISP
jgi:hypothetical protein